MSPTKPTKPGNRQPVATLATPVATRWRAERRNQRAQCRDQHKRSATEHIGTECRNGQLRKRPELHQLTLRYFQMANGASMRTIPKLQTMEMITLVAVGPPNTQARMAPTAALKG